MRHITILTTFLILAACGGAGESEHAVLDQAAELSAEVAGDGDEGSTLLLGFEVYPGSNVQMNMTSPDISMLLFDTQDSVEDVVTFYRSAGEERGFSLQESTPLDNQTVLRGSNEDGAELILTITEETESVIGDMTIRAAG